MKFTITKFEPFTSSAGKAYARTSLKNDAGTLYENVTIFGSHPGYIDLKEGAFVEGELTTNDYNGRKGWKMQALVQAPAWATKGPAKSAGIAQAQAVKREDIKVAQGNKAESIKISSTFRDATLITIESFNGKVGVPAEDFIVEWKKWRNWLWNNYDVDTSEPPF